MWWTAVPSPIGELGVAADPDGVLAVRFSGPAGPVADDPGPVLVGIADELDGYFAGRLTAFSVLPSGSPGVGRLPLRLGGTPFERAVWEYLSDIPYGQTRTYGAVAAAVGDPRGARAVGVACHRNPLPVLVPCHRVVGAGNKLVGFGGGLARKRYLLELEARVCMERDWA
ncbi:MAG TPA: methylated-DNA--[protein]-cysteine S-methyltransferase [Micromonosporaceae bacterium]|nr:methylated-DNA--[protein]-cysteine S-methyltransferase [Micromonosporaceae bacterium]